jgi:hypothetical protein
MKPPVRLVGPLDESELANRNTYIRARYDNLRRLVEFEKGRQSRREGQVESPTCVS